MRELKLTTRIYDQGPMHAQVRVWQNGGFAGILCVDAEQAERVVAAIANGSTLLAQRDRLKDACGAAQVFFKKYSEVVQENGHGYIGDLDEVGLDEVYDRADTATRDALENSDG